MAIIGVDVDGILADFSAGYAKVLIKTSGRDLFPCKPYDPPCWYWAEPLGYTKEEDTVALDWVKQSENFWQNLEPYADAGSVIDRLWKLQALGHDVYFITNRPGINSKRQTERWIWERTAVLMPAPTVLVSEHKGMSAAALELTHYIDDKPSNCTDVIKHRGLKTLVYLMDRSWNAEGAGTYVTRVKSVHEMLDAVEGKVTVGV